MYKGLDWEVQKYGHIIQSQDIQISSHIITTKIYVYKSNYYVETWIDDVRYLFQPLDQKGSKTMKKIEIDAKLVQGLLATTVTADFRLADNPVITFIKANTTLNMLCVLGIISDEELKQFQEMLNVNYSSFMEIKKGEAKRELNKKFGLNKEGDNN